MTVTAASLLTNAIMLLMLMASISIIVLQRSMITDSNKLIAMQDELSELYQQRAKADDGLQRMYIRMNMISDAIIGLQDAEIVELKTRLDKEKR